MSTISKLNPKVREDRGMRRALLREIRVERDAALAARGAADKYAVVLSVALNFLAHVRRSPWRTGQRKNELFQAMARELAGNAQLA